ncbi:MAG: hypothetical protein U1E65_00230 [Myxococcota bacterium]
MERSEPAKRRLPEDAVRAGHLRHVLGRRFEKPSRPAVPWELRVRAQKALSQVAGPVLAAFLRARAVAADDVAAASLESLTRELDASGLVPDVSVELLDALAAGPVSDALVKAVRSLAATDALGRIEPRVVKRVVIEIRRARHTPQDLSGLTALFASEGFFGLSTKERVELMAYLSGPEVKNGVRAAAVDLAWGERRAELGAAVSTPRYTALEGNAQAELLRDFLYYPSEPVYFMEARIFGGRSVVCFGEPSNRPSLSYAQISRFTLGGPFGTRIESPDACVASGYRANTRDSNVLYTAKKVLLSREEVRRTVEWIENSHEIGGQTGRGEISRLIAGHRFYAGCFRFVEAFTAGRPVEVSTMFYGRPAPATEGGSDPFAQSLLSEFLAAA